jgi:hypothetical protein
MERNMSSETRTISAPLVHEFVQANRGLLKAVRDALEEFSKHPKPGFEGAAAVWKSRVLPTLESDFAQIEIAAQEFAGGKPDTILHTAYDKMSLSKDLDNFSLEWAKPDDAKNIKDAITEVVLIARRFYGATKS